MIRYLFSVAWLTQLSVGSALFILSCWIEIQVLQHFLGNDVFALVLAIALEVGKALAILWNRFLQLED
ncbi:hypothetical protein [Thiothrix eikelboomii]|uniref:hypothetical protein n=1 Tax=Thiothrix eikelboomii TaxID=92487 RepID=UPI003BAE722B